MDYHKYIKYKTKYLELKNKVIMEGGSSKSFKKTIKFFIMATIKSDNKLQYEIKKIQKKYLDEHKAHNENIHITLLTLELNYEHPLVEIFFNEKFLEKIKNIYLSTFQKTFLISKKNDYGLYGKAKRFFNINENNIKEIKKNREIKFLVKKYKLDNEIKIIEFRNLFYKALNKYLNKNQNNNINFKIKEQIAENPNDIIAVISYDDTPLYAVPAYYFEKGKWKPHISLFSNIDMFTANSKLYTKLQKQTLDQKEINVFIEDNLRKNNNIDKIDLIKDINSLVFSYVGSGIKEEKIIPLD